MIEIVTATISGLAAVFAARAMRYSKPTGNGFANEVRHELRYIRDRLDRHMDNHR